MLKQVNNLVSRLTKQVDIYQPTSTADGQGGRIETMTLHSTVWAEFKKPRFSTGEWQGAQATIITQGISIRDITAIRRGWQVRWNGLIYEVEDVDRSTPGEAVLTTVEVEK